MNKLKELINKFKSLPKKKKIIYVVVGVVVILSLLISLATLVFDSAPKSTYEVAIMVRDQYNKDKVEDRKNSLKVGDVLIIQPEGHKWSKTESISYLILKMSLTEKQKMLLMAPEEREIKFKELSEEEQNRIEEEKKRAKEENREYYEEPRTEILRARAYNIDMAPFKDQGFKALDLLKGQPFSEEIYDWSIVDKKPNVKQ